MNSATRREMILAAIALGKDHHGRGFAPALHGGWPDWKIKAYMEGYNAAQKASQAGRQIYEKKTLRRTMRGH